MIRFVLLALAIVSLFAISTPELAAQFATGRVLNGADQLPVEGAIVRLLTLEGDVVAGAQTNSAGEFTVHPPQRGAYFLSVSAFGYRPVVDGTYDILLDPLEVTVYLRVQPVVVRGFEAAVEATDLSSVLRRDFIERQGFFDRRRTGHGYFVMADSLGREPFGARDFVRGVLGISAVSASRDVVSMTRCGNFTGWINGVRVHEGGSWALDQELSAADVFAVEIYPSIARVPLEFSTMGSCGAVLVWTR